jgi:SAM-dependent methyltransferase
MRRAGAPPPGADLTAHYLARGRTVRSQIEAALPASWSWDGRRALDFGCGAGRVLRHFLPEGQRAELWGCDIDGEAVGWLRDNLSPPLRAFELADGPALPFPDEHLHLIWANSVFTHIHRDWAQWLLELRRVLAPGGRILLTFLNAGRPALWRELTDGADWDPDRLGMAVFRQDAPWDRGGPIVFHSEWWIRAHWGRAFAIDRIEAPENGGQHRAVMSKRAGGLTPADLERPEPGEPREGAAALWERDRLRRELDDAYSSRSWRLSRPLRALAGRLGR